MRVLHLIAGGKNGGAETFFSDALKSLSDKGVEQYVMCRPHETFSSAISSRNIPHTFISFNRLRRRKEMRIIERTIDRYKPDLVHAWMNRAASFVPRDLDEPVLGWFGGYYNLKNYSNCDFYMGVTKDIVRHIGESSGLPHRAFLGHTFGTLEKALPVRREDFGIPNGAKVALLLSRMHWKKGVDTLLEAAAPDESLYLLLAGDGPELDKYSALAVKLGIEHRVRFLGWRTDREALLRVADVCVLPSRYEPFGTVIPEAWHARTPLVASRAAGASQYVTDRQDGMLFEIDDVSGLRGCLSEVLEDETLRSKLIAGGLKTYQRMFERGVVTSQLIESYEEMVRIGKIAFNLVEPERESLTGEHINAIDLMLGRYAEVISKNARRDALMDVASAYMAAFADESVMLDAVYLELCVMPLLTKSIWRKQVRILSQEEVNRALENDFAAHGDWRYNELISSAVGMTKSDRPRVYA